MKAAIYVRRGEQLAELELIVRGRLWRLVDTFIDNGRRRDRRPEFRSMLAAARRRQFEVLVVHRSSILARSLHELVKTLLQLERYGVRFVSATEPFDRMTFSEMLSSLSAFERDVIADRTREALTNKRRRGSKLGRPRSCSYETVMTLRARGFSLRQIADELAVGLGTVQRALRSQPQVYRKGSLHDHAQACVSS